MIQAALQAFFGDEFEAISFSEELLQQNLKNVEANKKEIDIASKTGKN